MRAVFPVLVSPMMTTVHWALLAILIIFWLKILFLNFSSSKQLFFSQKQEFLEKHYFIFASLNCTSQLSLSVNVLVWEENEFAHAGQLTALYWAVYTTPFAANWCVIVAGFTASLISITPWSMGSKRRRRELFVARRTCCTALRWSAQLSQILSHSLFLFLFFGEDNSAKLSQGEKNG